MIIQALQQTLGGVSNPWSANLRGTPAERKVSARVFITGGLRDLAWGASKLCQISLMSFPVADPIDPVHEQHVVLRHCAVLRKDGHLKVDKAKDVAALWRFRRCPQ
jgi:hypothetical protein